MNLKKGWDMDFDIPVLSLQPIVENAIKYGVGDKKGRRNRVDFCTAGRRQCFGRNQR